MLVQVERGLVLQLTYLNCFGLIASVVAFEEVYLRLHVHHDPHRLALKSEKQVIEKKTKFLNLKEIHLKALKSLDIFRIEKKNHQNSLL